MLLITNKMLKKGNEIVGLKPGGTLVNSDVLLI